ncbi:MAG: hypothetical protein IPM51_10900 [Sphingobacteriaceae bacterium]|nr:hypothetical protein [Sphingobacteriaceae bacterium]
MNFRKSIPTFVFGLSIGLLLGIAFFLFKINDIFKSLKDNVKEQVTIVEKPNSDETESKKNKERFKINIKKSSKVNYKEVDSLIKKDSELNVATDELISIKNIKIIQIESEPENDSLANKLVGIETKPSPTLCFIEFWKTPLNSKGYRYTKNKLQLYGFADFNDILIYKINDEQYLKTSEQVFKLQYGSEFKKLEKVIDNEVLAKLN